MFNVKVEKVRGTASVTVEVKAETAEEIREIEKLAAAMGSIGSSWERAYLLVKKEEKTVVVKVSNRDD